MPPVTLIAMALALTSGCVPAKHSWRAGASGTVVDSASNEPISNASVELVGPYYVGSQKNLRLSNDAKAVKVATGTDGSFDIPSVWRWTMKLLVPPGTPAASYARVTISADGHELRTIAVVEGRPNLGVVKLKRE